VDLEADAVAERVAVAVFERGSRLLGQQRRDPGRLERLARAPEQLAAGRARADLERTASSDSREISQ
jgi:hypothetical protein